MVQAITELGVGEALISVLDQERPTDMIRFRGENGDGISWTAQGHGATDDFSRGELRLAAKPLVNFLMSTVKLAGWPAVFFSTVP